jgi:hypothetical protein
MMLNHPFIVHVEDYEKFIGAQAVERILKKARPLQDLHVVNVNSTYYGGGVAELLGSMTILMNTLGIKTGWRVIQGSPDFFSITKKMHNALQGGRSISLSGKRKFMRKWFTRMPSAPTWSTTWASSTTLSPCPWSAITANGAPGSGGGMWI